MKIISLWEPWATLMALGKKRIETRSWATSYRGALAIHATKAGMTMWELERQCLEPEFLAALAEVPAVSAWLNCIFDLNGNRPNARECSAFPFGQIVAVVNLIDCKPTGDVMAGISDREPAFGNYEVGRFAWITTDLKKLPKPMPFKGRQGLRDVPHDVAVLL